MITSVCDIIADSAEQPPFASRLPQVSVGCSWLWANSLGPVQETSVQKKNLHANGYSTWQQSPCLRDDNAVVPEHPCSHDDNTCVITAKMPVFFLAHFLLFFQLQYYAQDVRFAVAHCFCHWFFVGREAPHDGQFYWSFFWRCAAAMGFCKNLNKSWCCLTPRLPSGSIYMVGCLMCARAGQTLLFAMVLCSSAKTTSAAVLFGGLHFRKRICQISGLSRFRGTCFEHGRTLVTDFMFHILVQYVVQRDENAVNTSVLGMCMQYE